MPLDLATGRKVPVDATGIVFEQQELRRKFVKPKPVALPPEADDIAWLKSIIVKVVETHMASKGARKSIERLIRSTLTVQAAEWRRRQLASFTEADLVSIDHVLAVAAEVTGITLGTLRGPNRRRTNAWPRFFALAVLHRLRPDLSLPMLGKVMGGRDHSTVLHALKQFEALKGEQPFAGWMADHRTKALLVEEKGSASS